ncbi:MAG: GNAT family protein [Nostocoides sp.]
MATTAAATDGCAVMFRRRVAEHWPVRLSATTPVGERVLLRPLTARDEAPFVAARRANAEWLSPWDATNPVPGTGTRTYADMLRIFEDEAGQGRSVPLAIEVDGRIVGQVNLSSITLGSFRSCSAGYWMVRDHAGRGIMPTALATVIDHGFSVIGLHRVEVNVRPENAASLAVVRKLGLRSEGLRRRMLHIDGAWRDHESFAITVEELNGGTLRERLDHPQHQSH